MCHICYTATVVTGSCQTVESILCDHSCEVVQLFSLSYVKVQRRRMAMAVVDVPADDDDDGCEIAIKPHTNLT